MGSPKTKKGFHEAWFAKVINKVNNEGGYFHPVILESLDESRCFCPGPPKIIPPDTPQIRDYPFLKILHHLLFTAPPWSDKPHRVGVVGLPLRCLLDWSIGTTSGHAVFLDPALFCLGHACA
jgi:phosphatidylserine decarboxylase